MLIKYGCQVINLNSVSRFYKSLEGDDGQDLFIIGFEIIGNERTNIKLYFRTEQERDEAFESILDCFRWQRMQCTLDLKTGCVY